MDEEVDSGDIIATREVEVKAEDTAHSLYYKVTNEACKLFKKHLPQILENTAPRMPRPSNGSSYFSANDPFSRNIDWKWSADKIDRLIRALTFPPFPSAKTYFKDFEVEILNPVKIVTTEKNGHKAGQVIDIQPDGLLVQTQEDSLLISKVRINESLVMDATKFSQQFEVTVGDVFQINDTVL